MEIAITKLSSKGQVVIPLELREDMKEGDKLIAGNIWRHFLKQQLGEYLYRKKMLGRKKYLQGAV